MKKYCDWRNTRHQNLLKDDSLYYDKPIEIDWNNTKDQELYHIQEFIIDNIDIDPAQYYEIFQK